MAADVNKEGQGPGSEAATGPAGEQPAAAEAPEAPAPAGERPAAEPELQPQPAVDWELRLEAAEVEATRLKDELLRALAEVENVRKRAARDKADAARYAISGFARDLLPVVDNLQRALASVEPGTRAGDSALEALVAGVEMTGKALLAVFERHGITPIAAAGERFDPHVHEAMFEVPDESVPAGTVVQVLEPGFMIHDRPLRPARVAVSRGGPKPPAAGGDDAGAEAAPDTGATRAGTAAYEGAGPGGGG
ncbi:MAG: nucleotide exchange factor GrpE, partial [Rhodospirillales bacterium]